MRWDEQEGYWHAIDMIEAQSLLLQLTIADYPNLKPSARRQIHREWHRMAYPASASQKMTTGQLAEKIKAMLRG